MPIAGFYNHPRRESCPRLSWSPPAPTSQLPEPCAVPARRNLRPRRTLTRRQSQKHRVLNARCQNERSTTQPRHHHARTLAHRRGGPGRAKRAPRARPPARLHGRGGGSLRSRSRRPSRLGRRDAAVVERGARVGGWHRRGGACAADVRPDVGGRAAGGGAGTGARSRRALHPGGAAPLRPRPLALRLHRHPPRPPRYGSDPPPVEAGPSSLSNFQPY
jgi:hypothetical protein